MFTKVAILCVTLVTVNAGALLHGAALAHTGTSVSSRHQDVFGNYGFGYDIVDGLGASNSRSEVGDAHGNKQGSYTLHDIDGRARRVDYVADGLGFRAAVSTNEPGTAHSAPAAALVSSPYAAPIAPVAHHAAVAPLTPIAVAHAAPIAPISHHGVVAHAAPLAVAHAAPVAYTSSSAINHFAPAAALVGHVAAAPVAHHSVIAPAALGYAGHLAAPVSVAHAAPVAYSSSSAVNHIAPVAHHVGPAHVGLAEHGFIGHRLGGVVYGGLRSVYH